MRILFGDSQSLHNPADGVSGLTFDEAYSITRNVPLATNLAMSGQCFADIAAKQAILLAPEAGNAFELTAGTNDFGAYGTAQSSLDLLRMIQDALVQWLVGQNSNARGGTAWTFQPNAWVGSLSPWPDNFPISMSVNAPGATAQATFTGDNFALGYILQDGNTASFTLAVDGVPLPGPFFAAPPRPIATPLGGSATPALHYEFGFGPGQHTLSITTAGWPYRVSFLFISSGPADPARSLKFFAAPPRPSLGDIGPVNAVAQATALRWSTRGYEVEYHDDCASLVYPADFWPDLVHVNNRGNLKRALLRS